MSLIASGSNAHAASSTTEIDAALAELRKGSDRLAKLPIADRIQLAEGCLPCVQGVSRRWVEAACQAKQIPANSPARAEEITAGPLSALRYLRLILASLREIQVSGHPQLPAMAEVIDDQVRVPAFPTKQLFDRLLFAPISAEIRLRPSVELDRLFGDNIERLTGASLATPQVALVLGAGNVSAIPVTDALTKILQDGQAVLLKMNPVNDYLGEIFETALRPLIEADVLRIVYGGADVGAHALNHPSVDTVHITGSNDTHDAIVWGPENTDAAKAADRRQLTKPITSELGNVTPWVIAPCQYSGSELAFQAKNIVASIVNNASFNCVATKVVITWDRWPQRSQFLGMIQSTLDRLPERYAYYPGAEQRYRDFSGRDLNQSDGGLPWTFLSNASRAESPQLFERESFVCVCCETSLPGATPAAFLEGAVDFMNEQVWGTLACSISATARFQRTHRELMSRVVTKLRYGTIGINQWAGLAYGLMSLPWGAFPVDELPNVTSGVGTVHNTYLLDCPEKTVLRSATKISPQPMWFSGHRRPEALAWKLCSLYAQPALSGLPGVFWDAIRG